MSPPNGSRCSASSACSMRLWSRLGSFARSFLAGLVTSRVQFVVELVKGYVLSALKCGAAPGDSGALRLRRRVHRVATLEILSQGLTHKLGAGAVFLFAHILE